MSWTGARFPDLSLANDSKVPVVYLSSLSLLNNDLSTPATTYVAIFPTMNSSYPWYGGQDSFVNAMALKGELYNMTYYSSFS